ncbi:MAG: RHS repeat domain-containing protein, partial [Pseudonocardiaceae bacterium]
DVAYRHDLVGNAGVVVDRTPGSGVAANPDARLVDDPVLRALVADGDALIRRFTYDPLYRLLSATGRECTGNVAAEPWIDAPRCGWGSGNHGTPNQDNAPRLTAVYRQDYAYDLVGNLLRQTHTGTTRAVRRFESAPGNNRLAKLTAGATAVAYRHDPAGNIVREADSRHFEWDHSDRMKAFRTQAGTAEPSVYVQYLYGAAGERVMKLTRKQDGSIAVTTYVDGIFEHHRLVRRGGGGAASTSVHVMDGGRRVLLAREGSPHPDDQGPATQYVLSDHLGNSAVVVDREGGFVNREEFTPYGETSFGGFARKRFRFNGKERDEESGLGYHGARCYAPWLGRWTSCDPQDPDPAATSSLSSYPGLAGNPINRTDPDGRSPDSPEPEPGIWTKSWRWVKRTTKARGRELLLTAQFILGSGGDHGEAQVEPPIPVEPARDSRREQKEEALRSEESRRRGKKKPEGGGSPPPPPPDPPGDGGPGGADRGPSTGSAGASRAPGGSGRRALRFLGQGARFASRALGTVAIAVPVALRAFTAGRLIREGQYGKAVMQLPLLVEDLSPVPSGRPSKISYPNLGPDQSGFRDRIESPYRSACGICHDAVRVDNWFKTTAAGRVYEMLHGPATRGGFPTDHALKYHEQLGVPLNRP